MGKSKKLAILGAGESGVGAAILAKKMGYEVWVSDKGKVAGKYAKALVEHGIDWEEGTHTLDRILSADEVVKSPGIPDDIDLIKRIRGKGIPVISEIEFAGRHTSATTIAITGSNGKTTTTTLTHSLLKNAGLDVGLVGNIGFSFARQVAEKDHEYYVIEMSSFQLDGIADFAPDVAVLLNITPDHLDRYDYQLDRYVDSKFRITQNQTDNQYFIYCLDDQLITSRLQQTNITAKCLPFSQYQVLAEGAWIEDQKLIINLKKKRFEMFIYDLALQGRHNLYNSMAAGIVARIFDLRKDGIRESLKNFQNLEHRLEFVAKVHGIEFINDSKATNVNSTWFALETMDKPVVWIVGGVDKGNDYASLVPLVKKSVKMIICLGNDNRKIHEAFSRHVDLIVNTGSAQEAVKVSYHFAQKGDVVLLSPACASFDLFENYQDRGWQFKNAVKAL